MKMKRIILTLWLVVFTLCLSDARPIMGTVPEPTLDDIFQLLWKGRESNVYHARVEMRVIRQNEDKTYVKEVWADFPEYYREEFEKKPENPELFGWMQRRPMFFLFNPGDFPMPGEFPHGKPPGDFRPGEEPPPHFPPDEPPPEFGRRRMRPEMGDRREYLTGRIERAFNPVIGDGGVVAGRPVFRTAMEPKNLPRPKIVFLIDKEYGTILQVEFYRYERDEWVLRYGEHFLSIEYNPAFPESTFTEDNKIERHWMRRHPPERPPAEVQELDSPDKIGDFISFPYSIPGNIPEGFSLERIRVVKGEMGEVLHLHYSDGVYAFSIFQGVGELLPPPFGREMDVRHLKPGEIRMLNHEGRTVLLKHLAPVNYVLVGNCPETIVRPIFEALRHD